jgi:hypothetical protein
VSERLLGDAHPGVADDADRALEHRGVRHEALDPNVGRRIDPGRIDVSRRDHGLERLAGEGLAGGRDDRAVVLKEG